MKKRRIAAPFRSELHLGSVGKDVVALKRALSRRGYGRWSDHFTPVFGLLTKNKVKRFQRTHGLSVDGAYGARTHQRMVVAKGFDRWGAHLWNQGQAKRGVGSAGAKMVAVALFAYSHRPRHYTQSSARAEGYYKRIHPPQMWNYADCSAFVLWCAYVALGEAEARKRFGPLDGYTGTLCVYGTVTNNPKPGDLCFYGSGPPFHHVAMYIGHGKVCGHGHEGGPFIDDIRYSDYFYTRTYAR